MPAINVAKTDTFEIQRQKINQIGNQIFSISQGGSDLATGNLKLGDGSTSNPSLAFTSDNSLGIYKSQQKTIGYVVDGKKTIDISPDAFYSYKDLILQKRTLNTNGINITNNGTNYDPGSYNNLELIGGSGSGATANITVTAFTGEILNPGSGYNSGSFSNISLQGGSGSGAIVTISIESIEGEITSAGSNYAGGLYQNVPLTGGSGSGATANITVGGQLSGAQEGTITQIQISSSGSGYLNGDILSANNSNLGGSGSGFQFTITSNPGEITDVNFAQKGSGYNINDILTLPEPVVGVTTALKGKVENVATTLNSASTTITVSSNAGIVAGMNVTASLGSNGALAPSTTVQSVNGSTQVILSTAPAVSGTAELTFTSPGNLSEISVASTVGILVNSIVTKTSGTGSLATNTRVSSVNDVTNTITLSTQPTLAGSATLTFSPPYGNTTDDFQYKILNVGEIDTFSISAGGNGYSISDILSFNSFDVTQPIVYNVKNQTVKKLTFSPALPASTFSLSDTIVYEGGAVVATSPIYKIKTNGGNISYILIDNLNVTNGDVVKKQGNATTYTLGAVTSEFRYFINTGSGFLFTPNLTLYVGNTYNFNFSDSSNNNHIFSLSQFRDGIWGPSFIENISTTLSDNSSTITVSDTTGILPGMQVNISSGNGALQTDTRVLSVNGSTTIVLDKTPTTGGIATLNFRGIEYTNGVVRSNNILSIKVNESTPNLYYYCATANSLHVNEGGDDNEEALITINPNNPKVFGSQFSATVESLNSTDVVSASVELGEFSAISFVGEQAEFNTINAIEDIFTDSLQSNSIVTNSISSLQALNISGTSINLTANTNIGSAIQLQSSSGNITTSGILRTNNSLNINNILTISDNNISTSSGNNIQLSPPSGRVAKINASTALVLPSGTSAQRPGAGVVENGSIRFNTQTNQYEGYSSATSSWSSLGGVRDLDGNTYITAEESIGSNDNRLWFYNDNINTVRFTRDYQEFVNVKKVRSLNVSAPLSSNWTSNTPVVAGEFLKYLNNIYEVVIGGTTGTSGSEPTNTTGNNFTNGTSTLKYSVSAVAPLTFEEISELRIAPLGGTPLIINGDLRLRNNIISTDINDLLLQPNTGKKVTVNTNTSLVLPVGTSNERGAAARGSVRFNSTILQYEGYDGTNWSSLGGVRDVDGNTYIVPETSAGSDENILYFYNNGNNTLRVTENNIELDYIDTFESQTSNTINLNAQLITFDNLSTSIDNSSTNTFISTTKDNLDFGLSSGLTNDLLLRLSDTGNIYYNLGFGTGVYNGIKLFDNELKEFELADYKIFTAKVNLNKGTINNGDVILYDPALHTSAKVQVIAHNQTTGDKEFIEYSVIDKGSDIFFTDFGNVKTGAELISCIFDFNASNNVRITFTLDNDIASGNLVEVTVISNIIKR